MLNLLPESVSTFGPEIDRIFYMIYYITAGIFILVTVAMVTFLIMFRYRPGKPAAYLHGNTLLEIIWTVATTALLLWISFASQKTWAKIKREAPPSNIEVELYGKQFNWDILYPGPDSAFGTEDDLAMENELHVPVNQIVRIYLQSKDVIHSLFIPNLRFKQDAVPGRRITTWFEATKPGKYEMPCAELCGFGHSGMKGWLFVHTPEEYKQWMKENWPAGKG